MIAKSKAKYMVCCRASAATIELNGQCITSRCMAWREQETANYKSNAEYRFRRDGRVAPPTDDELEGYCAWVGL